MLVVEVVAIMVYLQLLPGGEEGYMGAVNDLPHIGKESDWCKPCRDGRKVNLLGGKAQMLLEVHQHCIQKAMKAAASQGLWHLEHHCNNPLEGSNGQDSQGE